MYMKDINIINSNFSAILTTRQDIQNVFHNLSNKLSVLKEMTGVDKNLVEAAEAEVKALQAQQHEFSEMAKIRNMQWWSVEYGLIGAIEDPKIYGASANTI